jgi:hypothetical protein
LAICGFAAPLVVFPVLLRSRSARFCFSKANRSTRRSGVGLRLPPVGLARFRLVTSWRSAPRGSDEIATRLPAFAPSPKRERQTAASSSVGMWRASERQGGSDVDTRYPAPPSLSVQSSYTGVPQGLSADRLNKAAGRHDRCRQVDADGRPGRAGTHGGRAHHGLRA